MRRIHTEATNENEQPRHRLPWKELAKIADERLLPLFREQSGMEELMLTTLTMGRNGESFSIAITSPDLLTQEAFEGKNYEVIPDMRSLRINMPSIFEGNRMRTPLFHVGLHVNDPHQLELSTITVDSAQRGKGLGKAFESCLREWAAAQGVRRITGENVSADAAAFFTTQGWRLLQELTPTERFRYRVAPGRLRTVTFLRPEDEERFVLPRWKEAPRNERLALITHSYALREWLFLAKEFMHGETSEEELRKVWPSVTLLNDCLPPSVRCDNLELASHEARRVAFKALFLRIDMAEEECLGHIFSDTIKKAYELMFAAME